MHQEDSAASYTEPCSVLARLCPRPSPPRLRAARLSVLARIDPDIAEELSGSPSIRRLIEFASSMLSAPVAGVRCSFCGKKAEVMAEVWDYVVEDGFGVAVLRSVAPACRSCYEAMTAWPRLAKHERKLVRHLAKVNKVKNKTVEEAIDAIRDRLEQLDGISLWRFRLEALPPGGAREAGERLLERIAEEHPGVADGVLYYSRPGAWSREHVTRARQLLCGDPSSMVTLAQSAVQHGLEPNWSALEEYLDEARERLCRSRRTPWIHAAWVFSLEDTRSRARFFGAYMEHLSSARELAWAYRVETPLRPSTMVYVYTPSLADLPVITRVLREAYEIARRSRVGFQDRPVLVPIDPCGGRLWRTWLYRACCLDNTAY